MRSKSHPANSALTDARSKAELISSEFNALSKMLGQEKINSYQKLSFGELIDELDNIKHALASMTDRRPQPIGELAECYDPGYKTKASIAGHECTLEDLEKIQKWSVEDFKELKTWIGAVIKWHRKNSSRRGRRAKTQS